jgi:hypothetical protein
MDEERPEPEKQGWKFVSVEEVLARKRARIHAEKRARNSE